MPLMLLVCMTASIKHRHSFGRIQVANWRESRLGRLRGPFAPFALQFPSPCEAFRRAGSVALFVLRPTAAMTLTSEMDRALCEDVQNTGFTVGVCIDPKTFSLVTLSTRC